MSDCDFHVIKRGSEFWKNREKEYGKLKELLFPKNWVFLFYISEQILLLCGAGLLGSLLCRECPYIVVQFR